MRNPIDTFLKRHRTIDAFVQKVMKDNVGMLASVVSWALFTSTVPIVAGLAAFSAIFLHSASRQREVITHLESALAGAFTRKEITDMVTGATSHNGLLGVIGFLGILWGGSNVGGAISTVFQPIFQVRGRNFIQEKLIDIGMIFVFTALLLVVVGSTTIAAYVDRLFTNFPFSGTSAFLFGTLLSLLAAFLLFAILYIVFPNTDPRLKLRSIWPGAAIAAVLFEGLSYVFPIYSRVSHFQRYGAVIFAILLFTAWTYFLSVILLIGAEVVSFRAIERAAREGRSLGPLPDGTVPQRARVGEPPEVTLGSNP